MIDVFAGCGGLGEGFSTLKTNDVFPFDVRLSIEKELAPFNTLWTRAFYHQFRETRVPDNYYAICEWRYRFDASLHNAILRRQREADSRCLQFELGNSDEIEEAVTDSISKATTEADHWVLIGGPPCQAYSTIGRVKKPVTSTLQSRY